LLGRDRAGRVADQTDGKPRTPHEHDEHEGTPAWPLRRRYLASLLDIPLRPRPPHPPRSAITRTVVTRTSLALALAAAMAALAVGTATFTLQAGGGDSGAGPTVGAPPPSTPTPTGEPGETGADGGAGPVGNPSSSTGQGPSSEQPTPSEPSLYPPTSRSPSPPPPSELPNTGPPSAVLAGLCALGLSLLAAGLTGVLLTRPGRHRRRR
jgi:hypothetical protein